MSPLVPKFERKIQGFRAGNETYTQFFPKLHSTCGERVWQNISRTFFRFLSRVSKLDTSSAEKMFEQNTFHEKGFQINRFRMLTELHLSVQRNVLFRITVLDFFSWVHDFEPNVLGLGRIFLIFVFEKALYVTTRSFKRMFFSGKTTPVFIILKFWAETFD